MNQPNNFNLSSFEATDTAELHVLDQKDDPIYIDGKPFTIVLCGPGSQEYARAQSKLDQSQQTRTFAALRGKPMKDSIEEQRRQHADKLAACTVSVNNFPIEGGALAIYTNPKLGYITNQVAKFIEDWSNFTAGSTRP